MSVQLLRLIALLISFCLLLPPAKSLAAQDWGVVTDWAPEQCDLFVGWSANMKPDPNGSLGEQWLAQPDIQDAIDALSDALPDIDTGNEVDPLAQELIGKSIDIVFGQPWAFYIPKFEMGDTPRAVFIVQLDDFKDWATESLEKIRQKDPDQHVAFDFNGQQCFRYSGDEVGDTVEYGILEGYLVAAVGEGELSRAVDAVKKPRSDWVKKSLSAMPVERNLGLFRFNISSVLPSATESDDMPAKLHLEEFQDIVSVLGIDGEDTVSRTTLFCPPGPLKSPLATMDLPPLVLEDLNSIPDGIDFIGATKFSMETVWNLLKIGSEDALQNNRRDEVGEFAQMIKDQLEIDLESELVGNWGDYAYSYNKYSIFNPLGTGVVGVRVKDASKLAATLEKIAGSLETEGMAISEKQFQDTTIYSVDLEPEMAGPGLSTVSFCQVENELLIAAGSRAISSHLRKAKKESGKFIENQKLLQLFDNDKNGGLGQPIMVHYLNLKPIIETLYAAVPMLASGPLGEAGFSTEDFPPIEVITFGIQPNTMAVYRTKEGFQLVERSTLPGITSVTPVAIGLLLPAVQQARNAARRAVSQNNLRQLLLANLNFEATKQGLPSAYTKDQDDQPLLSWRVHVLPFLGESKLYEKFKLDEPWDGPHNKALIKEMPAIYSHPQLALDAGMTVYLGVTGENGVLGKPEKTNAEGSAVANITLEKITDGLANTLMVVEANAENAVVWSQPQDLNPGEVQDLLSRLKGNWPGDLVILGFCDGHVESVNSPSEEFLRKRMTMSGNEPINQ